MSKRNLTHFSAIHKRPALQPAAGHTANTLYYQKESNREKKQTNKQLLINITRRMLAKLTMLQYGMFYKINFNNKGRNTTVSFLGVLSRKLTTNPFNTYPHHSFYSKTRLIMKNTSPKL